MLIKDKDILVQDNSDDYTPNKPIRKGISKEHMSEAWGDAFDYYLRGITSRYLQFRGRATRLEFWGFAVVASILYLPLYVFGYFVDMPLLPYYYALATLIPTFAVTARRFHDIGKRSAFYLSCTVILLMGYFVFPIYVILPLILWTILFVRLLSRPTVQEEGLYGEPNQDDEIYGSDNPLILNKFRLLTIVMSVIWLIATGTLFDNWSRQAEQKGTIELILEDVETLALKRKASPQDVQNARAIMMNSLKQLQGQAISDKKKQELILDAVNRAMQPIISDEVAEEE